MTASLVAVGSLLAARLLLLTACVERWPVDGNLALGFALANGQLSGLPGAQLATLRDATQRFTDRWHRSAADTAASIVTLPRLWSTDDRPMRGRLARLRPITELHDSGRPNETESDSCLAEVSGCRATAECRQAQTSGVATGYPLAHRLLYAVVAEKMPCPGRNTSRVRDLCSLILRETTAIAHWGFPVEYRDLFSEQVALCGSLGYSEFLRADWFMAIASWQLPTGCYAEQPMYPGHHTAVAAAALSVGIRAAHAPIAG